MKTIFVNPFWTREPKSAGYQPVMPTFQGVLKDKQD